MDSLVLTGPADWAVLLLALAALGALAGFLAGLLGVGGGIVLVPGLYYIFQCLGFESDSLMHIAVGTSLAIIVPTGFSSARAHWRKGAVQTDLVKSIGIGILMGVVIGTVLADRLSGEALKMIYANALVLLAVIMIVNPSRFKIFKTIPGQPWPGFAGGVIGTFSTLVGIGGATLSVPYMTLHKVPIHKAIGSASAIGLVIAIPAALGFILIGLGQDGLLPFSLGFVNLPAWALIIPASVLMAPLGASMAHKVPVDVMRKIFAVFMVIVATKMWFEVLS